MRGGEPAPGALHADVWPSSGLASPLFPLPACLQPQGRGGRETGRALLALKGQSPVQPAAMIAVTPKWKEWLRFAPAACVPTSNILYN